MVPAQVGLVEGVAELEHVQVGEAAGVDVGEGHPVVRAEEVEADLVVGRGAPGHLGLQVVVARRHREAGGVLPALQRLPDQEVGVRPPGGQGHAHVLRGPPLHHGGGLVGVHVADQVEAVARVAGDEVHPAADGATVGGPEAPGLELDVLEELGGVDAGQAAEVEDRGHRQVVHVDLRVAGVASPDHELPGPERRASHAREVLHHLDRVAGDAGDADDLGGAERLLGDLALLALAGHHRLVHRGGRAQHPVGDLGELPLGHRLLHLVPGMRCVGDHHLHLADRDGQLETAFAVRVGRLPARLHQGRHHREPRAHLQHAALQIRGRGRRRLRGRRLGEREGEAVLDAHRRGLAVNLGRREAQPAGRLERGLVEAVPGRLGHGRLGDLALVRELELQRHLPGQPLGPGLRRILGLGRGHHLRCAGEDAGRLGAGGAEGERARGEEREQDERGAHQGHSRTKV